MNTEISVLSAKEITSTASENLNKSNQLTHDRNKQIEQTSADLSKTKGLKFVESNLLQSRILLHQFLSYVYCEIVNRTKFVWCRNLYSKRTKNCWSDFNINNIFWESSTETHLSVGSCSAIASALVSRIIGQFSNPSLKSVKKDRLFSDHSLKSLLVHTIIPSHKNSDFNANL